MIRRKTNQVYRLLIRYVVLSAFLISVTAEIQAQETPGGTLTVTENAGLKAAVDTHAIAEAIIYNYKLQQRSPDSSIRLLQGIIAQSRKAGFSRGIGGALAEIGGTYLQKGDYGLAEQYILQSQAYPILSNYTTDNAWNNLGFIYAEQGKYEKAIISYKKAMESYDQKVAVSALNNFTI